MVILMTDKRFEEHLQKNVMPTKELEQDFISCTSCDSDFEGVKGVREGELVIKRKNKQYEMTLGKHMLLETIFLENGEKITHKQVVDKLNELTEENKKQKLKIKTLQSGNLLLKKTLDAHQK